MNSIFLESTSTSALYSQNGIIQTSVNITGSGSILVSNAAELKAALVNAKGGETIVLAGGTYDPVSLKGLTPASNVTITSADGANPAVLTGFYLANSKNITIRNVEMFDRDAQTNYDFQILKSDNVVVDHVKVHSNDQHNSIPFMIRSSTNVTVSNSEFTDVRYALSMLSNNGVTITNNSFHDIRADGIRGGGTSNITISDNVFTNFYPADGDHADAIQFWTSNETASAKNITITNNAIIRGDGAAIQGIFMNDERGYLPYENVVIQNNLAVGTLFNGISVANANGLSVIDNIVAGTPDQKSWIRVPASTNLNGNVSEHYVIGGVSTDFPEGNQQIPPLRDDGSWLIQAWIAGNFAGVSGKDAYHAAEPAPIPTLVIEGTSAADALYAAKAEDSILRAGDGNDRLYGRTSAADVKVTMEGGNGDDAYFVYTNSDLVIEKAGEGSDTVYTSIDYTLTENVEVLRMALSDLTGIGNALDNRMVGTSGTDTFYGEDGDDTLQGLAGDDFLYGGAGNDNLNGGDGNDFLSGGSGDDLLIGAEGNDIIDGGAGNDKIEGGAGADKLTGGAGLDTFIFRQTDLGATDIITDYNPGEDAKISLSLIDANTLTAANEAFKFIGTDGFSGKAGELRYSTVDGGVLVEGDVNGDRVADLSINLLGLDYVSSNYFNL